MPKSIWLNGKLVKPQDATVSVYDHGLLYGDGVFEGIRVYGGRIFKCATHLRRLEESARAIRLQIPYTAAQLTQAMRDAIADNGIRNGYIRLCVTRGVGALGLNPFTCETPTVFIIADTITLYPAEFYEKGMAVITAATIRNHPQALSPRIKSMNYLNNIMAKVEALDAGLVEAVMLNHQGNVAECTGDNIFIVRYQHGDPARPIVLTPPLHAGVLEGVTRNVVIELIGQLGLDFAERDMTRHDLYTADEMFLTGTAAEAIPVTHVDQRVIGAGKPGTVTQRIIGAFHALVTGEVAED